MSATLSAESKTATIDITNSRTVDEKISFSFSKVWLTMGANSSSITSDSLQEWPSGKEITVRVYRKDGSTSAATEDTSFELVYTLNAAGSTLTSTKPALSDSEKAQYGMTCSTDSDITTFSIGEILEKMKDSDTEWVYFVEETAVPDGYQKVGYDTTPDATIAKTQGAEYSPDGGTIINQESSGYVLPSTGGPGTEIFKLLGSMLVLFAGAGFILLQRKKRVG